MKLRNAVLKKNLEIVEDPVEAISDNNVSVNVDKGAFYSQQAGKTIYTGEVQLAPDGHYWKHMGNNEWVKSD